jgi:penicillin-binding protein 2
MMADFLRDRDEDNERDQFTRRSLLLGGVQAAALGLVGWRFYDLQVLHSGRYAPMAEENSVSIQSLAPKRGRILDASGRVLADNEELFRVTITPSLARNVGGVLRRVSRILPLTDEEIERLVARTRKNNRNLPTTIASDISFEQVAKLNVYAPSLPGIETEFSWRRRYRDGEALSHVVGFVGSVERFGIDDEAVMRIPDIRIGKSGAELGFDADLRGSGGTEKSEVDAHGRVMRVLDTVPAVSGRDVRLTVDIELQKRVFERIRRAGRASAVVLDIASGEIAVMISVPGFDPAAIAHGLSDDEWAKLSGSDDKPLLNRSVAGLYAPGSTFLAVTALAALEGGVVSLDEHITCNGRYEYGGQIYRCSNPAGHGSVTLHDAVRSSCEVFFCAVASRLGIARIAAAARAMGMGAIDDIGLPDEKPGVVPDPDWKRGNLNSGWLGGETLLTAIGQGYMQATPLQLAIVAARLASGCAVAPLLRKSDVPDMKAEATSFRALPFKPEYFAPVREAMTAAVNDAAGTAKDALLGDGKPAAAGSTGISATGARMPEGATRGNSVFIGFEPANAPRYAIATVVEGTSAAETAASVARDILNLTIDRDAADHAKSGADGRRLPGRDARFQEAG